MSEDAKTPKPADVAGRLDGLVMPCSIPCPKCGNDDIHRLFFAKGKRVENEEYCVAPCDWTVGQSHHYKAIRDLIKHHCRCCQYGWVTKPLSKRHNAVLSGAATETPTECDVSPRPPRTRG